MQAILYINKDGNNYLDKNIQEVKKVNILMKDDVDVINPTLILTDIGNLLQSNYIYIDRLKRYYFINDYEIINNKQIKISCHVDVLKTHKDMIKRSVAYVTKNASDINKYLLSEIPVSSKIKTFTKNFIGCQLNSADLTSSSVNYILTVVGKKGVNV